MLRAKLGIDNPTTTLMIATTTSSSVKVKPACEANCFLDLGADSTPASPFSFVKNLPWACHTHAFCVAVCRPQANSFALKNECEINDFCSGTFVTETY